MHLTGNHLDLKSVLPALSGTAKFRLAGSEAGCVTLSPQKGG